MSRPSAEPIAAVIADIRAGRIEHPASVGSTSSRKALTRAQRPQPVVDCTAIYAMQRVAETVALYDDHPSITPPWEDALLCYVNTHGNVICMQVGLMGWDGSVPDDWFTENPVDWARVRWIAFTTLWVGGQSGDGRPLPTTGPVHMFRHAIRDDGAPEDINWVALLDRSGRRGQHGEMGDANQQAWEASLITLGSALNFLNCTNTDVAEPARPRATRRRIERTGVTVQTIVVRPPGKRRAKSGADGARPIDAIENVLSPVRGHFSHYGPAFDRGLLFGKYAGKFWIPSHARGAGVDGEAEKTYVLRPASGARESVEATP